MYECDFNISKKILFSKPILLTGFIRRQGEAICLFSVVLTFDHWLLCLLRKSSVDESISLFRLDWKELKSRRLKILCITGEKREICHIL